MLQRVAVGLIWDPQECILVSQRPRHKNLGGLWEFPGGKCEGSESFLEALRRELREELGIQVESAETFWTSTVDYPELTVKLVFFTVTHYSGDPYGKEGQHIEWVTKEQLSTLNILPASLPVVRQLIK